MVKIHSTYNTKSNLFECIIIGLSIATNRKQEYKMLTIKEKILEVREYMKCFHFPVSLKLLKLFILKSDRTPLRKYMKSQLNQLKFCVDYTFLFIHNVVKQCSLSNSKIFSPIGNHLLPFFQALSNH